VRPPAHTGARVWGPPSAGMRAAGRPQGGRQPHASARPPPMTQMWPAICAAAARACCGSPCSPGLGAVGQRRASAACLAAQGCLWPPSLRVLSPGSGQDRGAPWRCLHMHLMACPCTRTGPATRVGVDVHTRSLYPGECRQALFPSQAGWVAERGLCAGGCPMGGCRHGGRAGARVAAQRRGVCTEG